MNTRLLLLLALLLPSVARAAPDAGLVRREWIVDGVRREGLVHEPAGAAGSPVPVVFVFHGHGGSPEQVSRSMSVHEAWPEALVVYLRGLPTRGQLTDPSGKQAGWQGRAGAEGDRDLKFFDAVLASLRRDHRIDERRIYATGHSNGGSFTYLLWAQRPDVFAAYGPSAAVDGRDAGTLRPAPVVIVAGEADPLVKFAWQKRMIESLLKTNQCAQPGQPAGKWGTLYASKAGAPILTIIHPGTHKFPPEATAEIVRFFKEHAKS